jgi:two-component system, chemotaxis family, CheB/CheR fusion protein
VDLHPPAVQETTLTPSEQDNEPLTIVGIGASAGGLDALERLFDNVPADSGMAFVVVQHLSPDFKSKMDGLLSQHTAMPIQVIADVTKVAPNTIYLAPAMTYVAVRGGELHLTEVAKGQHANLPIDVFFESLAEEAGARAVGVILSGTGHDGSQGIQAIRRAGGLVIAQSPESAQYDAMPHNAINTGVVDFILSPDELFGPLKEQVANPGQARGVVTDIAGTISSSDLDGIFRLLQSSFHLDFAKYKPGTVERRVKRRMGFRHTALVSDYTAILSADRDELDELYHDLLIGVTEFFRDEKAFQQLETTIIPELFTKAASDRELRVWSAGCATGEEAYSLAILFAEKARELNFTGKITVFATDVHKRSLETAAEGVYTRERLAKVSPEQLRRYFTMVEQDFFKVNSKLRKMLVFARHDLTCDIPFSRIDLVLCRNLLIYLRPEAQKTVLAQLHFALNLNGILFLGRSEGIGSLAGEFEVLSKQHNLFRKIGDQRLALEPGRIRPGITPVISPPLSLPTQKRLASLDRQLLHDYDKLLGKHIPPGILIDDKRQVLHYFGNVTEYLKPPSGRVENDVLLLTDDYLHVAMGNALQKAKKTGQRVVTRNIRISPGVGEYLVDLTVDPLLYEKNGTSHYHVYFERVRPVEITPHSELREMGDANIFEFNTFYRQHVTDLEGELHATREDFQATLENLQSAIEELNATNEELQSTNEELQSTNEELNSANEELQSTNEELFSVSSELEKSNGELTRLNTEHVNLLDGIESGIVYLDRQMRIRNYNPAISAMFKLMPQDIGRPLDHIAYHLPNHETMLNDVRMVIKDGSPIEKEVATRDGKWLLKRIVPLRSETGRCEGAILMFTDISKIKEAETVIKLNEELQRANANLASSRADLETQNKALQDAYEKLKTEAADRVLMTDELRQKEQMLIQQNRMAAMGEMLNNIAHQWRQPLNNVGLMIQELGLSHELGTFSRELLDASIAKAMKIVLHMSQTIEDFRSFFTPDKEKSLFEVDQVVRKAISLVEDDFRNQGITIEADVAGEPEASGFPNEYAQVLLNILTNARDAFLERGTSDARVVKVRAWQEDGRAVVTIADNAGGIPDEIMDRIFDAYFTTKELGKGTGIGLFMSNTIIEKNMGGRLTVRNVGDGVEFRIEV